MNDIMAQRFQRRHVKEVQAAIALCGQDDSLCLLRLNWHNRGSNVLLGGGDYLRFGRYEDIKARTFR